MPKGIRKNPASVAIVEPVEAPVEVIEAAPAEVLEISNGFLVSGGGNAEYLVGEVNSQHEWPTATEPVARGTPVPQKSAAPAEDLAAYAKRIERAAQPLAVCFITHPDAVDGAIFEGVYAGIRLVNGPEMSARLSDGNTI